MLTVASLVLISDVFETVFDSRGFVKTRVKSGAEIQINHAVENSKMVMEVSQGKKYPLLVDLRNVVSITKEARDHFSMKNREPGVIAIALLINSPMGKIIGNFYMLISKPTVPTHLFTKEEQAVKWLMQKWEGYG